MTEKKEPIKLCSQCRLSDPTREQSTAIPWGNFRATMIVLLIAYWRINSEVVSLTVLKCNILSYSSNVIRRLPKKLLSRRNMKKKYMISCGSTSWVGGIPWQWKYGRHCAIDTFAFFFDSRSLVIFSLLSTRAILRPSERLEQVSTYHENTPLSNIKIAGDKRSLQIILGQRYSINRISRFFPKLSTFLGCPCCTD